MVTTSFEVSVGGGRASAHLDLSRSPAGSAPRALGIVALLLVLPVMALLTGAALASATGSQAFDVSRGGVLPERLGIGMVIALPLLALALLAVSRVRLAMGRDAGRWRGRIDVRLAPVELVAALLGLFLLLFFVGHLLADGYACVNGLRRAC